MSMTPLLIVFLPLVTASASFRNYSVFLKKSDSCVSPCSSVAKRRACPILWCPIGCVAKKRICIKPAASPLDETSCVERIESKCSHSLYFHLWWRLRGHPMRLWPRIRSVCRCRLWGCSVCRVGSGEHSVCWWRLRGRLCLLIVVQFSGFLSCVWLTGQLLGGILLLLVCLWGFRCVILYTYLNGSHSLVVAYGISPRRGRCPRLPKAWRMISPWACTYWTHDHCRAVAFCVAARNSATYI